MGDAIENIQHGTQGAAADMDKAVKSVEDATSLAGRSGKALREIVTLVETASDQCVPLPQPRNSSPPPRKKLTARWTKSALFLRKLRKRWNSRPLLLPIWRVWRRNSTDSFGICRIHKPKELKTKQEAAKRPPLVFWLGEKKTLHSTRLPVSFFSSKEIYFPAD